MIRCFIGLGSNLEKPEQQIKRACKSLQSLPETRLVATSPLYQSTAIGPGDQPDYINGVAELDTALTAEQLLDQLQTIENQQARKREIRWGPRTLDLDLLLFGDNEIDSHRLQVPHPRLHQRNFVLYPLHDLAPNLQLPDGQKLVTLLNQISSSGLKQLTDQLAAQHGID